MVLFNRIRNGFGRITGREWALLSLETIGVLLGILGAFALNEWAQRRDEHSRRTELAGRLFEEAQLNVGMLRSQRDELAVLTQREQIFATALVHDGACPDRSLWDAVVTVRMYPAIAVQTAAYDEMVASGGLGRIDDLEARKAVADFRSVLDWYRAQNENFRSARLIPLQVDDPRVTVGYDAKAEEPETFEYDRPALCADRGFRARIADQVRDHALVSETREQLTKWAIRACVRLGVALQRECVPRSGGPLQGEDAIFARQARTTSTEGAG